MWMYFGIATVGDPDRGVFLEIRPGDMEGEGHLTHLNLFEESDDTGLVLLAGDTDACFDALERLAADLGADTGFLDQLDDESDSTPGGIPGSTELGWVWLDKSHLFNVSNSAIITIGDGENEGISATAVVFMTKFGGVVLYAGSREEAEEYLFLLADWLNASSAIGDTAGEFGVSGDMGQRVKA